MSGTAKTKFLHYREDVVEVFGESRTEEIEKAYFEEFDNGGIKAEAYVRHATNGKAVVTGPFRTFIGGIQFAMEREELWTQ